MLINKTSFKLGMSVAIIILLAISLTVTSFALIFASVSVNDNYFLTGNVKINLNGGQPIIEENEFLFEPGMTVVKDFFIENLSSWDVYYKLYFGDISGGLADVLEIKITDGESVVCEGTMSELNRKNVTAAAETLKLRERRELKIYFHFPPETGNYAQDLTLSFSLCAEAVQTKNNPNRLFE